MYSAMGAVSVRGSLFSLLPLLETRTWTIMSRALTAMPAAMAMKNPKTSTMGPPCVTLSVTLNMPATATVRASKSDAIGAPMGR